MSDADPNPSLEALLAQVARGDRQAFQRLYRASSAHLFGAALRILQDRSSAEEAVQEAYLQIWNNARTYRPETAPALAWMATIARYRALDIRRRDCQRRRLEIDLHAEKRRDARRHRQSGRLDGGTIRRERQARQTAEQCDPGQPQPGPVSAPNLPSPHHIGLNRG